MEIISNSELKTPEDGVAYIHEMLDRHEEVGMLSMIKGIHLHMSLSGEYVKKQKKEWEENPMNFEEVSFYELFRLAYEHACFIDQHQPFIGDGVKELIDRIGPKYVTFEFQPETRLEYEQFAKRQSAVLGYLE